MKKIDNDYLQKLAKKHKREWGYTLYRESLGPGVPMTQIEKENFPDGSMALSQHGRWVWIGNAFAEPIKYDFVSRLKRAWKELTRKQ